ncbi:hypothetical protein [Methylomonas koyamae]|uniref:hypothetical protein n=1 Tax=Methylomonas koyamae TaxID=702114 RepID=UPI0006D038F6|nr:hypothetical protein [Methylomonas koyamae]BBL58503.1 hypothetical protein MKFW12EY_21160 [Methylomonas koyamae]
MNTPAVGKIRPITKKQLSSLTQKHFGLKKPFQPLIEIRKGYTGHWEIYNQHRSEFGVTDEQKTFMLDLIEQHGGVVGGAK